MCGLCGVLGGRGHWSESSSHPQVFQSRADQPTRQRERQQRTRLLNKILDHYQLSLSDWGGGYLLRSRTGQTLVLSHLGELWATADKLGRTPCDPLDPNLLQDLRH